jgi:hypothetical protein
MGPAWKMDRIGSTPLGRFSENMARLTILKGGGY